LPRRPVRAAVCTGQEINRIPIVVSAKYERALRDTIRDARSISGPE
jgi:hypothetical protein